METQHLRKFCPVCKLPNDANAILCEHCGAAFIKISTDAPTTQRPDKSFELTQDVKDQVTSGYTPPPIGLCVFLLNNSEPIALRKEQQVILGRGDETLSEPMVDLTKHEGFVTGVSRRHAMLKAVEDKYVLIDLNSSNGTWLNGERLLPNKPHDLRSGGVIQVGRLKLVVVYIKPPTSKKNNQ